MPRILWLVKTPRSFPGFTECAEILVEAGCEVVDAGAKFTPQDEVASLIEDVDGVILGGAHELREMALRRAGRLTMIVQQGIGVDHIDMDVATSLGIVVSNTAGSNRDSVADHAFTLMLALLRQVVHHDATTRQGRGWENRPPLGQLAGRCMGVVGTGSIGKGVVRRAAAGFGMTVLCHDPYPDQGLVDAFRVRYVSLDELLANADVVTLHVPILPETKGLIGARELALMKPGAILVNTARADVVDTTALVEALRAQRIAGAAIDAWSPEPCLHSDLWTLPNTVVSPHLGGNSVQSSINARAWSAKHMVAALHGHPVDVVNREVLTAPGRRLPLALDGPRDPHRP